MEDLRQFTFAPLDVMKKNVPSDSQLALMDKLITRMDLTASDETAFSFHPSNVCDPYRQRYFQVGIFLNEKKDGKILPVGIINCVSLSVLVFAPSSD